MGIDVDRLRRELDYDSQTGIFRWKINQRSAGKIAGCDSGSGYIKIHFCGKLYRAHRLAWAHVHGELPTTDIDHLDRDRSNNRICNLRLATQSQNSANSWRPDKNTSGFKGVSWRKRNRPWVAYVKHMGKSLYLGSFFTAEEAHAAYCSAAERTFGEFANP